MALQNMYYSGAPNDGFLLNTLKTLFRLSTVLLEMHSKWHYKISYLFSHPKLQGLEYYFPENFRCNLMYYKSETFSDSSLPHFLIQKF